MSNPSEGARDNTMNPAMTGSDKGTSGSEKIRSFSNPNKDKRESPRDFESKIENKMEEFGDTIKEQGRYISGEVVSLVKRNPWAVIGGTSIAAIGIGYLLGRRSSKAR